MNTKRKNKRWRLIADIRLQGHICFRVVIYWVICQLTLIGTIAGFGFLTNETGGMLKSVTPAFIVSLLFLPIALFDVIRFSNRFVGPVVNIKRKLDQLAKTGESGEAKVRNGDYYSEICDSINELRLRFEQQEKKQQVDSPMQDHSKTNSLESVV